MCPNSGSGVVYVAVVAAPGATAVAPGSNCSAHAPTVPVAIAPAAAATVAAPALCYCCSGRDAVVFAPAGSQPIDLKTMLMVVGNHASLDSEIMNMYHCHRELG